MRSCACGRFLWYLLIHHEVPEGVKVVVRLIHSYEAVVGLTVPTPDKAGLAEGPRLVPLAVRDGSVVRH